MKFLSSCSTWSDATLDTTGQLGYDHFDDIGDEPNEMGDTLALVNLGTNFVVKQMQSGYDHRCVVSADARLKVYVYLCQRI